MNPSAFGNSHRVSFPETQYPGRAGAFQDGGRGRARFRPCSEMRYAGGRLKSTKGLCDERHFLAATSCHSCDQRRSRHPICRGGVEALPGAGDRPRSGRGHRLGGGPGPGAHGGSSRCSGAGGGESGAGRRDPHRHAGRVGDCCGHQSAQRASGGLPLPDGTGLPVGSPRRRWGVRTKPGTARGRPRLGNAVLPASRGMHRRGGEL